MSFLLGFNMEIDFEVEFRGAFLAFECKGPCELKFDF